MGTLASGAFYLLSPLAMPGNAAPQPADMFPPMTMVRTPVADLAPSAPRPRGYVIFDAPAINRTGRSLVQTVVGEEVRKHLDGAGIAPIREAPPDAAPVAMSEAVIAAHDERIALIRKRLAAIRSDPTYASSLDDLRVRLRRAIAARRLAIVRADDAAPPTARIATGAASLKIAAGRSVTTGRYAAISSSSTRAPIHHSIASMDRGSSDHIGADRSTADHLASARRSLATARQLLEQDPPVLQVAGLWHWPGSEHWTLPDSRRSA